ncbi:MAG: hypothetical protein AAF465_13770 [Pseudomonadota bacterium]
MSSSYVDPVRKAGNQAEVPSIRFRQDYICFDGYQQYCLSSSRIRMHKADHRKKYGLIRPYLLGFGDPRLSLIDLGCSAGVMGFQAYLDGFRDIAFVDHDAEYLELVNAGLKHIDATAPKTIQSKVEGLSHNADVLFAFALIHWLYSATEQFGSLDRIIAKLSEHGKQTLFIEWVGPECPDIKGFGHLDMNASVQQEAYTKEKFVAALEKHYKKVVFVGDVRIGRELWMATNGDSNPSAALRFVESVRFLLWRARSKAGRMLARIGVYRPAA